MAGVRIRHATEVSTMFTMIDGSRPYREPFFCPPPVDGDGRQTNGCGRVHEFKAIHMRLDDTGATIVSQEIWARLQRIVGNPFTLVNEVANPPAQRIVLPRLRLLATAKAPGAHHG